MSHQYLRWRTRHESSMGYVPLSFLGEVGLISDSTCKWNIIHLKIPGLSHQVSSVMRTLFQVLPSLEVGKKMTSCLISGWATLSNKCEFSRDEQKHNTIRFTCRDLPCLDGFIPNWHLMPRIRARFLSGSSCYPVIILDMGFSEKSGTERIWWLCSRSPSNMSKGYDSPVPGIRLQEIVGDIPVISYPTTILGL